MKHKVLETLRMLVRRLWLVGLCAAVAFGGAFAAGRFLQKPVYESRCTFLTNISAGGALLDGDAAVSMPPSLDTCRELLTSRSLLAEVAGTSALGYSAAQVGDMLRVVQVGDSQLLEARVRLGNPEHARRIAEAVSQCAPASLARLTGGAVLRVVDGASAPVEAGRSPVTLGSIGAGAGALLCVLALLCVQACRRRVKSESDLAARFDLPVLGVIPDVQRL